MLASAFIAESHRGLPMLRMLLPLIDPAGRRVRWSEFVSLGDELASLDWWEVVDRVGEDRPEIHDITSCRGVLDAATAAALGDVIGDDDLSCLQWTGYADAPRGLAVVRERGEEYFVSSLRRDDLKADARVPEFAWGSDGTIAWGARL